MIVIEANGLDWWIIMEINEKIKELRTKNKLTQKEFANKTGLSISTIQKYEYGDLTPSESVLFKICKTFDISPDELLKDTKNIDELDEMEKYYQILFTDTYQPDKKLRNILIDLDDREVFLKKDEKAIVEFLLYNGFEFDFLDIYDNLLYCKNDKLQIDTLIEVAQLRQLISMTKKKIMLDFKIIFDTFGEDWETGSLSYMEILEKQIEDEKELEKDFD